MCVPNVTASTLALSSRNAQRHSTSPWPLMTQASPNAVADRHISTAGLVDESIPTRNPSHGLFSRNLFRVQQSTYNQTISPLLPLLLHGHTFEVALASSIAHLGPEYSPFPQKPDLFRDSTHSAHKHTDARPWWQTARSRSRETYRSWQSKS
jgi:hypothetical protein